MKAVGVVESLEGHEMETSLYFTRRKNPLLNLLIQMTSREPAWLLGFGPFYLLILVKATDPRKIARSHAPQTAL